jgi:hypothetical protein
MSILPKASATTPAKTKESKQIAVVYAVILVAFALAQLYTFDEFIGLIPSLGLPLGEVMIYALVPTIVAAEVFALPFLLRMKLSIGFRWFSMAMGWLVAALWLFIALSVVTRGVEATTIGFLGTVVDLVPGWWAVAVALGLAILTIWASWGLWPAKRAKK